MRHYTIDNRARCKYCSGKPYYYSFTFGLPINNTLSYKGNNRFINDSIMNRNLHILKYNDNFKRKNPDYKYLKHKRILSNNSMRGNCGTSSYFFKQNKDSINGYRILIACKCKKSIWMYPSLIFDDHFINRKLIVLPFNYFDIDYLYNANVKW